MCTICQISFSSSLFFPQVAVSNQGTTSRLGGVRIEVRDAEESLLLCEHTTAEADGIASWTQEGTSGQHLLITAWKPGWVDASMRDERQIWSCSSVECVQYMQYVACIVRRHVRYNFQLLMYSNGSLLLLSPSLSLSFSVSLLLCLRLSLSPSLSLPLTGTCPWRSRTS